MMKVDRRTFIAGAGAAGALVLLPKGQAQAAIRDDSYATLIDLTKCDGCSEHETPLCVTACRQGKKDVFPNPPKEELRDYWPQNRHEDWSDKKHLTDRFTPYNWIFVQKVKIGDREISIPRRCMHCDNPPCAKLCPFGVKHKTPEGPVYIDHNLCFGGAKCRTVCPWSVPQRQAGVGLYTLWQKYLPVGGGVMFKCDLCRDRLATGEKPFCMEQCPKKAMVVGRRDEIFDRALKLKEKYNGHIYGKAENGGTSTLYVSPVSFAQIEKALMEGPEEKGKKIVGFSVPENVLVKQKNWALLSLIAPVAGIIAALGFSGNKNEEEK
ncbi:MAG: 4Fe-4S dicluster domain-containing protein [Desulfopila sp.]|jgi:Fe-S-cluster-containing dehydrogenase component|nr:4Fe-4S dicluster domain-containing protein [Desulfopila sp.]